MPNEDEVVGQRIKALRESQGVSQDALGAALGVTQQQVSYYENGRNIISPAILGLIAKALRTSADDLIGLAATVPLHPLYVKAITEIETFGEHDRAFLLDMLFKHIGELRELNIEKAAAKP